MTDLSITRAGTLDRSGKATNEEKLRQAANQFENFFIQIMLKESSQASDLTEGIFEKSNASTQYKSMMNQALGEQMSGSLGIADKIVETLSARKIATEGKI